MVGFLLFRVFTQMFSHTDFHFKHFKAHGSLSFPCMFLKHTDLTELTDFYTDDIFFLHGYFSYTNCFSYTNLNKFVLQNPWDLWDPCAFKILSVCVYYCSPCAIEPRISMASTFLTMAVIGAYGGCLRHIRCLYFVLTQLSASGRDRSVRRLYKAFEGL